MEKVRLRVDGHLVEAEKGQNVLQAALDAGIYIPHLCYHPDLTPLGNCKLCTVEIEGKEGVVQSCETIVEEGMVVSTKTDKAEKLRMIALELMLASHPKDCTSCDKYLNCELQAMMQYMGVAHSRLREIEKENIRIQKSDTLIKKEMQRCIQCGRCIRVCEELRGVGALTLNKKDGETYVGTKLNQPLLDSECRFCGACVEVCPTGAIQDMAGIFQKEGPREMKLVPCKNDCPAHTDIPLYIRLTKEGKYSDAVSVIREKLTFPLTLGNICSYVCESGCKRKYLNDSISIRGIKKFAVENDRDESWRKKSARVSSNGKRVAVIGGGAAGMTAAYYLAKKGYEVEIFERQPLAGGMLSYGIPKYRIPQEIVNNEIDILLEEGMKLHTNSNINNVSELKDKNFDAILVAVGAGKGKRPPAFAGNWSNAINAVDFCRKSAEKNLPELGEIVTVYGGGNVGYDCARTAKKAGVKTVRIICMESRDCMLADKVEIKEGFEEGIELLNAKAVTEFIEEDGKIKEIEIIGLKSFAFTKNGLEMEIIEDSREVLQTDTVIFATGQQTELTEAFGIELAPNSFVKTEKNMQTNEKNIFACGDAVYGTKSVVEAIASGRKAASSIDIFLGGDGNIEEQLYDRTTLDPRIGTIEKFGYLERKDHFENPEDAVSECNRCLQCDLRPDIHKVKYGVNPYYKKVKEVRE